MPRPLLPKPPAVLPVSPPASEAGLLPSGWEALDRLLGGGWPGGVLSEIAGHGRCTLALGAVRQAQAAGQPAAWVDGPGTFCPPTAGVDLARLALVRPRTGGPRDEARCWLAADLLLRSRAFSLLVLDLPPCHPSLAVCFRLARQAAAARTVLLVLAAAEAGVAGSAASVLLRVRQRHAAWQRRTLPPPPALEVTLRRHRGGRAGARAVL